MMTFEYDPTHAITAWRVADIEEALSVEAVAHFEFRYGIKCAVQRRLELKAIDSELSLMVVGESDDHIAN